jgi:Protein of unknown function (DUF3006).
MKEGIVDRFEGDFAVIEIGGKMVDVARSLVDEDVMVNDVVIWKGGKWIRDEEKTKKGWQPSEN